MANAHAPPANAPLAGGAPPAPPPAPGVHLPPRLGDIRIATEEELAKALEPRPWAVQPVIPNAFHVKARGFCCVCFRQELGKEGKKDKIMYFLGPGNLELRRNLPNEQRVPPVRLDYHIVIRRDWKDDSLRRIMMNVPVYRGMRYKQRGRAFVFEALWNGGFKEVVLLLRDLQAAQKMEKKVKEAMDELPRLPWEAPEEPKSAEKKDGEKEQKEEGKGDENGG